MSEKREDYISWDEYFMGLAELSAMRSKDPNTQVGACIVNDKNRIVGIGYNGFPTGCSDDVFPWGRDGEELSTKYPYVVHAERNAVMNATVSLEGCRMYSIMFPCNECAKTIIQSGITELIYMYNPYKDSTAVQASQRMFDRSGVEYRQYKPERESLTIDFRKKPF